MSTVVSGGLELRRSSVALKAIAAASGLVLCAWLVLHVLGNLGYFAGAAALDGYAASLRRLPPLLWIERAGLASAAATHVTATLLLAQRSRAAVPMRARGRGGNVASRAMRLGGALLLLFVVYHLLHMTFGVVHPEFEAGRVHHNLTTAFTSPWVAALYVAASLLCALHLLHGLWSAPRSLGVTLGARARRTRRPLVVLACLCLFVGLASVPVAVFVGLAP